MQFSHVPCYIRLLSLVLIDSEKKPSPCQMFKVLHRHWPSLSLLGRPGGRGKTPIDPLLPLDAPLVAPHCWEKEKGGEPSQLPALPTAKDCGLMKPMQWAAEPKFCPWWMYLPFAGIGEGVAARKGQMRGKERRQDNSACCKSDLWQVLGERKSHWSDTRNTELSKTLNGFYRHGGKK